MRRLVFSFVFLAILAISGKLLPFDGLLRHIDSAAPRCSLHDQIASANLGIVIKACTGSDVAGTIVLRQNVTLRSALPPINSHITIFGGGRWIRSNGKFRVFLVESGSLTIHDTALRKGDAWEGGAIKQLADTDVKLQNVTISHSSAMSGGAIYNDGGRLEIENSSIHSNRASSTGGAISSHGTLVVRRSSIHHKRAKYAAGIDSRGTLDISNSTISNNQAARLGGGMHVRGHGSAILNHVSIVENLAPRGGGIYSSNRSLVLVNSLIVANHSSAYCGYDNLLKVKRVASYINDSCGDRRAARPRWLGNLRKTNAYHTLLYVIKELPTADPEHCPMTDQRGTERTPEYGCDIGAYEFTGNN